MLQTTSAIHNHQPASYDCVTDATHILVARRYKGCCEYLMCYNLVPKTTSELVSTYVDVSCGLKIARFHLNLM